MNVLLVWDENPDRILTFYIQDAPEWMLECHGKYINGDDLPEDHPIFRINDAVGDPQYAQDPEYAGKWRGCEIKDAQISKEGPFHVVICGFFM